MTSAFPPSKVYGTLGLDIYVTGCLCIVSYKIKDAADIYHQQHLYLSTYHEVLLLHKI